MSQYKIIRGGDEKTFDSASEYEDMVQLLDENDVDFETVEPESTTPDGGPEPQGNDDVSGENHPTETAVGDDDKPTLQEDPIGHLRRINSDFVNKVKGTPAISKRGFRYIQAELDITTQTEVVAWSDDPYGVVVWARAKLPDGRTAEAHGEGYPDEQGMDQSQFVRYADTRAKNRAISDLTSAGALAVDELRGGLDE